MADGKVILVGAGAGGADLISRRGYAALRTADVIITDRLIDPGLLTGIDPGKIRYVGKGGGMASVPQDAINETLIALAREGRTVVRLKGGDPLIFGRGGEELEALAAAGIGFEIVPGITAASVAAASTGIPLTHRDVASTVCFVTGHEDPDKADSAVDFSALAGMGTIVFYMSVSTLRTNLSRLAAAGVAETTPAAIVEQAGSHRQRTFVATVAGLADVAEREHVGAPALVIIGEVAALRKKLAWFEQRPLFGKTIISTRPIDRMEELHARLHELGACVLAVPTIALEDMPDYSELDHALAQGEFDWLVLTSPKTIEILLSRLQTLGKDVRALGRFRIAVIGQATAQSVRAYRIEPDLQPEKFTAEALGEALIRAGVAGKRILLLRAELADNRMRDQLTRAGAEVVSFPAYRTRFIETIDPIVLEHIQRSRTIDYILFTSSATVRGFYDLVERYNLAETIRNARRISIGPVTSKQLADLGHPADLEAEEQSAEGLTKILMKAT